MLAVAVLQVGYQCDAGRKLRLCGGNVLPTLRDGTATLGRTFVVPGLTPVLLRVLFSKMSARTHRAASWLSPTVATVVLGVGELNVATNWLAAMVAASVAAM